LGAAKDTNYILEFLKPLLNSKNKLAESKFWENTSNVCDNIYHCISPRNMSILIQFVPCGSGLYANECEYNTLPIIHLSARWVHLSYSLSFHSSCCFCPILLYSNYKNIRGKLHSCNLVNLLLHTSKRMSSDHWVCSHYSEHLNFGNYSNWVQPSCRTILQ
jgi:hypothetical protein